MTSMQEIAKLQAKSADWDRRFRMNLNQLYKVGRMPKGGGGGALDESLARRRAMQIAGPNWGLMTPAERKQAIYSAGAANSGIRHKYGQSFNDEQYRMAVKNTGGNPYAKKLNQMTNKYIMEEVERRRNGGKKPVSKTQPAKSKAKKTKKEPTLLEQYIEQAVEATERANQENQARYDEGKSLLQDRFDRNMERVKNYGVAEEADLEESFRDNLGMILANHQARGLGNSTIASSFINKNNRDLAREKQRLSEQVDDRAARYDQALSKDLVDFIERRTDEAPDYNQILELASKYGASGDGQGFVEEEKLTQSQPAPRPAMPSFGGGIQTPFGAARPASINPWARQPIGVNMFSGFPLANAAMQYTNRLLQGSGGIRSNRYPRRRGTPLTQKQIQALKAARSPGATKAVRTPMTKQQEDWMSRLYIA